MPGEPSSSVPEVTTSLLDRQAEVIRAEIEKEELISGLLPIEQLIENYRDSPNFLQKIIELRDLYGKRNLRRLRKDGSCFYRATVFRLAETLISDRSHATLDRLFALAPRARELFLAVGMEPIVFEDFEEVWLGFLRRIRSGETDGETLRTVLADVEYFNCIVMYLRFIISSWIRTDPLFEDYFSSPGEKARFCAAEVEQLSAEADQPQIVALHSFFSLPLRIFYVDNSWGSATVLSLPEIGKGLAETLATAADYPVQLLYLPGHYDLLY